MSINSCTSMRLLTTPPSITFNGTAKTAAVLTLLFLSTVTPEGVLAMAPQTPVDLLSTHHTFAHCSKSSSSFPPEDRAKFLNLARLALYKPYDTISTQIREQIEELRYKEANAYEEAAALEKEFRKKFSLLQKGLDELRLPLEQRILLFLIARVLEKTIGF